MNEPFIARLDKLIIILIALFLVFGFLAYMASIDIPEKVPAEDTLSFDTKARIGGKDFALAIADTNSKRVKGLSGQEGLAPYQGLLFVFEEEGSHSIWMKDMKFSIDIVWLDKNFTVVDIKSRVAPETYPEIFTPDRPALFVLEIPAGTAEDASLKFGDRLEIL